MGGENYVRLLHDPLFWVALRNTAFFVVVAGPLSIALSLGTALLITARPGARIRGSASQAGWPLARATLKNLIDPNKALAG